MNNEPQGFTDGDRRLAPQSPFHSNGPRKEVELTMKITVSAPAGLSYEDIYDVMEGSLYSDPYIRKVEAI